MENENILYKLRNKYFTLANKYFYVSIFILLVGILTWINNSNKYASVEAMTVREIQQLEKVLVAVVNEYPNNTKEEIQNNIINILQEWHSKAYTVLGIKVKKIDGSIKNLLYPALWDRSSGAKFEVNIEKLLKKEIGAIEISSVNNRTLKSVLESMTFSIMDIKRDIFYEYRASLDGKVHIKDVKSFNDDLISIHHNKKPLNINYKYISIVPKSGDANGMNIHSYANILVDEDSVVKKGDLIATGSVRLALDRVANVYYGRSEMTIYFAIFIFIILWLSRKRINKLDSKNSKN